jgi:hypothetical protein
MSFFSKIYYHLVRIISMPVSHQTLFQQHNLCIRDHKQALLEKACIAYLINQINQLAQSVTQLMASLLDVPSQDSLIQTVEIVKNKIIKKAVNYSEKQAALSNLQEILVEILLISEPTASDIKSTLYNMFLLIYGDKYSNAIGGILDKALPLCDQFTLLASKGIIWYVSNHLEQANQLLSRTTSFSLIHQTLLVLFARAYNQSFYSLVGKNLTLPSECSPDEFKQLFLKTAKDTLADLEQVASKPDYVPNASRQCSQNDYKSCLSQHKNFSEQILGNPKRLQGIKKIINDSDAFDKTIQMIDEFLRDPEKIFNVLLKQRKINLPNTQIPNLPRVKRHTDPKKISIK